MAQDELSRSPTTQTTVLRIPRSARLALAQARPLLAPDSTAPRLEATGLPTGNDAQLYREFMESIYDGVLITNAKGWILDCNSRAAEVFSLQKSHFRGLRVIDLVCGATESLFAQIHDGLAHQARLILEADCFRRDRSTFPCEITVNLLRLTAETFYCFQFRNISRRVEAEEALRQSEERFRAISESMSDWIWECDVQGRYTYCSERATVSLGLPVAALIGQPLFYPTTLEHRAVAQKRFNELAAAGRPFRHLEVWLTTQEQHWRCIAFSGAPMLDDEDRLIGFRGVAADVTEPKTKDAELDRYRHHLEELVHQRTEELSEANHQLTREIGERRRAEEELQQAVQRLEISNAELQQFGYVVSHDLKEPLRMIAGYCQLLERRCRDKVPDEGREFIAFAVEGAERMQRMIDDLLAYSRLTTRERHLADCDLNGILAQCRRHLQLAITEAGATVEVGPLPTVKGDATQLLLLFQNLLANGLKFCREGVRPHLQVLALPTAAPAPDGEAPPHPYHLVVIDNGIGIPAGSREDIFLIFHRLHEARRYRGTGIGLAICRKVVQNHGGELWVDSVEGQGSTFHIALPLVPPS